MAGITLEQAEAKLQTWMEAEEKSPADRVTPLATAA